MSDATLGRTILATTAQQLLDAESAAGCGDRFAALDGFLARLATRAFMGEPTVEVSKATSATKLDRVTIAGSAEADRQLLDDQYRLERQEARGAWFLPQKVTLKYGLANLPATIATQPRFAVNVARDATAKVDLRTDPDALAVWALVVPLFSDLLAPIDLRAPTGKVATPERQRASWEAIDATYADLGIDVAAQLGVMRYGGGWAKLRGDDQVAAKQALIAALADQVTADTTRRWRARGTRLLATAYYRKAKSGPPLARAVLTKPLQTVLSGLFAGDWLGFLEYLSERPNEGEKIATSLPEPRLYVGGSEKAAAIAAEQNLPVDEVERMLSALLGRGAGPSPVEERVAVLRRWWDAFDRVHAGQRPGMAPLWGLVDEGIELIASGQGSRPGLYRQLLPADLCADVDRLWDGVTLPRWPERIVSEFHPHRQMAEAFGPAVPLWNGVSLTCWYLCEGPYSRTDLDGLAEYHRRPLDALHHGGFPVDPTLFSDLKAAKRRLGPVQSLEGTTGTERSGDVTVTFSFSVGQRRDGFEILRDIVTRHRQAWAAQHLDGYLRHRWDSELREVAHEFNRRTAARGKPPTFKQFASFAAPAANHWFGGDLVAVHAALGESSPTTTARHDLLAGDPFDFAHDVFTALGGDPALPEGTTGPEYNMQWDLRRVASDALRYLQQYEALGRPPTPKEFGAERLRWENLGGEEAGWARFEQVIEAARSAPARLSVPSRRPGPATPSLPPTPTSTPPPPAPPPPKRKSLIGRLRSR